MVSRRDGHETAEALDAIRGDIRRVETALSTEIAERGSRFSRVADIPVLFECLRDDIRLVADGLAVVGKGGPTDAVNPTGSAATGGCCADRPRDTFEALTTPRRTQQAVSPEGAFIVLRQHARFGWRRGDLIETFISVVDRLHAGETP
jgi:hypothetical protein